VPEEKKKSLRRDELLKWPVYTLVPNRSSGNVTTAGTFLGDSKGSRKGTEIIEQVNRPLSHTVTMSTGSNGARRMVSLMRMCFYLEMMLKTLDTDDHGHNRTIQTRL
jgi:hypothetical protein